MYASCNQGGIIPGFQNLSDEQWQLIERLMNDVFPLQRGTPRSDLRKVWNSFQNREVREYLKTSKIKLHFLPPYSSNLNPVERLWKWMKERVLYNSYYEEFEDFKSAILGFFKGLSFLNPLSELGQIFAKRIRDKFRPLGLWALPFPIFEFTLVYQHNLIKN